VQPALDYEDETQALFVRSAARQVEGGSCLTENIAVRARPKEVLEAFDQGEHAASHERLTTAVSVAID